VTSAPGRRLTLRDLVQKYRELAGGFGHPLGLSEFGLSQQETERVFGSFDEDYHISRFIHFSLRTGNDVRTYQINGFPQSHISLDPEIETIL
jgi:hypothetical protein